MAINISLPDASPNLRPKITVIGVGGAGGNAVNNMIRSNLEGVDFLIANTDAQALEHSTCERRIQLGLKSTKGLGAGMRPDIGRQAAEETIEEIKEKLEGSHMIFVAAGMGGGTGTGAAPVIAKLARENGILTVGVITKPFHFEGSQRMKLADNGIDDLQQHVDTLLIIPNQNLFKIANENTTFADAFKMADDVLYAGVRGVTDLMVQPGLINLDFSDIKTVMSEMGKAMMGTGEAEGQGRAIAAAEAAIANPLIDDVSLKGAKGLIINITGGQDITLYEVDEAANRIKQEVDEDSNIIYGTTCDDRLEGVLRVSIVATGIDVESTLNSTINKQTSILSINNSIYQQETSIIKNDSVDTPISSSLENEDGINDAQDSKDISQVNVASDAVESNSSNLLFQNESRDDQSEQYLENTSEEKDDLENIDNSESENHQHFEEEKNDIKLEYNNEQDDINVESNIEQKEINVEEKETKTSVRRLSLFDTFEEESKETNKSDLEEKIVSKNEPVLENFKDINEESEEEHQETDSGEFNSEEEMSEEELNQDTEEELLDIPTFLRRQAN